MPVSLAIPQRTWDEPSAADGALSQLTPYLTTGGYWVFLPAGTMPPAGDMAGGFVDGPAYLTLLSSVPGRRLRRASAGVVFFR